MQPLHYQLEPNRIESFANSYIKKTIRSILIFKSPFWVIKFGHLIMKVFKFLLFSSKLAFSKCNLVDNSSRGKSLLHREGLPAALGALITHEIRGLLQTAQSLTSILFRLAFSRTQFILSRDTGSARHCCSFLVATMQYRAGSCLAAPPQGWEMPPQTGTQQNPEARVQRGTTDR